MPSVVVIALVAVAAAAVVAALVAVMALRRARAALEQARQRQLQAATESATLHDRVDELERRLTRSAAAPQEYVITHLGDPDDPDHAASLAEAGETRVTLTPPAFADAVLRETAVHTVSLLHGVRRALAPETRHRIRFEMRREIKRSRKARKREVKLAVQEFRARQRSQTGEPVV